jgi:hypothetical protein
MSPLSLKRLTYFEFVKAIQPVKSARLLHAVSEWEKIGCLDSKMNEDYSIPFIDDSVRFVGLMRSICELFRDCKALLQNAFDRYGGRRR